MTRTWVFRSTNCTAVAPLHGLAFGRQWAVQVTDDESVTWTLKLAAGGGYQRAGRLPRSHGPLDVVVANAGIQLFGQDARVGDLDLEAWE